MRILAFTDMHGRISLLDKLKKKAERCELVVCCGDLTMFENEMGIILKALDGFGKPVLIVHGNHEDEVNMERACKKLRNVCFIHKKVYDTGRHVFLGFGGGGFSLREPEFESCTKHFRKHIKPGRKIVLVTHGPPYGTELDIIDEEHVGCLSYKEFIAKNTVHLALCGHLHEHFGAAQEYMHKTLIMNPGPEGKIIEI
jgi:Icc-related predicted phosphoesterase